MKDTLITKIIDNIADIRREVSRFKEKKAKIGFVPTMGALHIGHESLIKQAKKECDIVIVSIFVNSIQFGPAEDFDKYPRQLESDREICSKLGVEIIFAPAQEEMYPHSGNSLEESFTMVVPPLTYQDKLCGKSRKDHFNGVATVVLKLFNIVTPDNAYFGKKDAQQLLIIKKMLKDLNLPVQIVDCPAIREPDGLACSSRNKYLTEESRKKALSISKALKKAEELHNSGLSSVSSIISRSGELLHPDLEIEYFEAYNADTLMPVEKMGENVLVAIAVKIDGIRLIDNLII